MRAVESIGLLPSLPSLVVFDSGDLPNLPSSNRALSASVTYPPPPCGYYPSPFPYGFSSYPAPASGFLPAGLPAPAYDAPPAFPYAATPHPAGAYAPPPGFFPAPAYGPSPFFPLPPPPPAYYYPLDPNSPLPNLYSPIHAPPPESTSAPTLAHVFFPAPAYGPVLPCPSYQVLVQSPESTAPPATQSSSSASGTNLPAPAASNFSSVAPLPVLPDHNSSSPGQSPVREDSQRLFDSLQGKLSKLRDKLSSMTTSRVCSSAASTTTAPTPSLGCTTMAASAPSLFCAAGGFSAKSPSDASTAAYVTPQVLGEMPTPSSWQGTTHGTTPPPHCCSRHNNPIQSPCVSDLSEQNLDEGSKQYDFHDLNIQSVFRADGTKHRYYALPEDYPLERAVPEPGFALYDDITEGDSNEYVFAGTNEYVDVFATTPEQQPYEEDTSCLNCMDKQLARHVHKASANAFSEQLLRCFSKQQETEPMSADVQDSTLQLQQQSGEMACNWPVLKASGSVVTSSNQLCIDHSMRELRLLWDPGASAFLVTPLKNSSIDFSSHDKTDLWAQYEHQFIVFREIVVEVMLDKPPAKPPDRFGIAESSLEVFLLKAKSENSSAYTHFNFLSCNIKQFSAVQARQDICFLLEAISSWKEGAFSLGNFAVSALWRNTTQVEDKTFGCLHIVANSQNLFSGLSRGDTENICISVKLSPWSIFSVQHILDSSMKKELIFSSGCILAGNPWSAILFLHYLFWEFSMDRVLSKTAVPHLVHRSEIPIKLLTFIEQPIALKHYMSHLLLQCHLWSQTQNAFPKVQYCCLPIVLDCLYSELVKQLGYSSLFSSTEICRSTTTVLMKLVWNSGKVAQEGRDEAVVYQVSKIQLPMRKISHVWELDILFITFLPP